jgi:GATA-binding protein
MDSNLTTTTNFDPYSSYSEATTPRTPSPPRNPSDYTYPMSKPSLDIDPIRNIFVEHSQDDPIHVDPPFWSSLNSPFSFNQSRGSLLQELYEQDISPDQPLSHDVYLDQTADHPFNTPADWSHVQQQQQHPQINGHSRHPHDYSLIRRATFPYVRRDHDDGSLQQFPHPTPFILQDHPSLLQYQSRQDSLFGESLPLSAEPASLQSDHPFVPSMGSSPHSSYHEFDHLDDSQPIKLEDTQSVIVPSQTAFFRPPSSPSCHPLNMSSYLSPHTGLPVQHTDDAHSKETQYLRRRCFNCHTTEPPSWRRSTLNPGKIVCNKCGLYERTHLRPRPLRFDELRAGNKARKQSKGIISPKSKMALVKKEPREFGLVRRSSVSSSASSSARSASGTSDWDDSVSVYSSGSAPPTSFNSPNLPSFPIPRDSSSQSPPLASRDGGIRLPNAPLSDIASLQQQPHPTVPHKSATSPPYYSPNGTREFFRRSSMPEQPQQQSPSEANGWSKNDTGAGVGVAMDVVAVPEHNNNAATMVALPTAVVS